MKPLISTLLVIHISAGFIALLSGLIPIVIEKGSQLHKRTGLVYVYCMMTVTVTALLLCGLQPFKLVRLFLAGMAIFSFYSCLTGWRTTKYKKGSIPQIDKLLTYLLIPVSLVMLVIGGYLFTKGPSTFAILFTLFGYLTFKHAWYDFRSYSRQPENMHWFYHHITRMGGSYIATLTAFLVNNAHRILPNGSPAWTEAIGWIAPFIIGSLLIARSVHYYQQKFQKQPTFLKKK